MKTLELPLTVDCESLDSDSIESLADNLRNFFEVVDVAGDELTADCLISNDFSNDVRAVLKTYNARILS